MNKNWKHSLKQLAAYYEAMVEANNYYGRNLDSSKNQVLVSVKAAISAVQQQLNIPLEKREKDIDKIVSKLNLK